MCFDGVCFVLDLLSQIVLGIVIYYTIKKLGFSSRIARLAFLVPVVYVIDLIVAVMEMDRGGWFSGPTSLGLPFEIFGIIAPFTAPVILMVFVFQEPNNQPIKRGDPEPFGRQSVVKSLLRGLFWSFIILVIMVIVALMAS